MKLTKNDIKGIAGTLLFHAVVLLCFIFFGFSTPLPLPEEEGVEVNLGYSDDGTGDIEPVNPFSQNAANNNNSSNENENITQNTEESVNLNKNKTENNTTQSEEPQVNKNALYPGKKNNDGGSQGITGNPGNQGNPNGNPNSDNYNGNSPSGDGISFKLGDRKSKSLPKPNYNSKDEGVVVVTIWVDKNGNVTKAQAGARGTTTTSLYLRKIAEDAARKSKFDAKANAPEEQQGTITYNFINLN
ncbi:MAG: energy transducer TonB [Bacteroidales bacterium]|jgi:TonB family protein|nr:energy transducer TonB [Bacteroidales bacterium]